MEFLPIASDARDVGSRDATGRQSLLAPLELEELEELGLLDAVSFDDDDDVEDVDDELPASPEELDDDDESDAGVDAVREDEPPRLSVL